MKNYKKLLLATLSLAVLVPVGAQAQAEKVIAHTHTETKDLPNVNEIDFTVFDTNEDGEYSMAEVGTRLFTSFDLDNNKLVDNREWNTRSMMTIMPIEKEVFKFHDFDGDGMTDISTYDYSTFYEASGLIKFDKNQNGLSAAEFIDTEFQKIDDNDDNLISLEEWKEVYLASRPKHEEAESYNQ